MQAWKPLPTAIRQLSTATMVLPEPTSPCSRRFIWEPLLRSARISFITRCWAPVSEYGRALKQAWNAGPTWGMGMPLEARLRT